MPNNSCTIVLNGHGCYSKDYVVDVSSINYNIVFPCGMNEKISNGHHNLLLGTLASNVPNGLGLLELLPTSYISNNTVQQQQQQHQQKDESNDVFSFEDDNQLITYYTDDIDNDDHKIDSDNFDSQTSNRLIITKQIQNLSLLIVRKCFEFSKTDHQKSTIGCHILLF